jgi:hypothetical protein
MNQRRARTVNAVSVDHGRIVLRSAGLLIALVALFASSRGIAAAAPMADCENHARHSREILVGASLENWEPVNDRTVLVWTGHETRAHLVRLDRSLPGLTAAPIIDLVDGDRDHSISACGHDGIRIGAGQGDGTVARILSIEYLSYSRTVQLDPGAQSVSRHLIPV